MPIQPISHSSPTKGKNNNLLQHISDKFKLKLQFKHLFQKIKLTSQVAPPSNNKKYRNISKAANPLKYLLQHVHNIKLISEQVNYIYAACFSPVKSKTTKNVEKSLTSSIASAKSHLDQQY